MNINSASLTSVFDVSASLERQTGSLRFLFASLDPCFPLNSGRRLRNQALLRSLRDAGHETVMVAFDEPETSLKPPDELLDLCRAVDIIPAPRRAVSSANGNVARLRAIMSALPYGAWRFHSPEFRAKLRDWLLRERFDALICDDIYMASNIPTDVNIPLILNKHGIGTVVLERYLSTEHNPLKRLYGWVELLKTRRCEIYMSTSASVIMTCSAEDCAAIRRFCPSAHLTIVPNVIDVAEYTPTQPPLNHTVVFAAYLGWYPNQDAVEFFVNEVMPHLRKVIPDVKFVAAGRNPPDNFRRRLAKSPGVEFTGAVPDIKPIIANAALSVVPLRIGTGTRLKILEAAALGRAVVSTRIGAEGLDFKNDEEIVIADAPADLAREIAELLASPDRAFKIGQAARKRVEQHYSPDALRNALGHTIQIVTDLILNKE